MPFTHWVSRIAVTTCIDQLRAQKRRPEFRWADLSESEAEVLDSVVDERGRGGARRGAGRAGVGLQVAGPAQAEDRLVIRLLDLEQRSMAEISELTGWNQSLVKVRAFRARGKLQSFSRL